MSLNDKDRLDYLKFISQTHRSQFDERRKYEWRIVFTTLSFYVLCIATVYGGKVTLPSGLFFKVAVWVIFLALAILVSTFLSSLHTANNINKTFAERAENAIADVLNGKTIKQLFLFSPVEFKVSWRDLFNDDISGIWAWRWQVIILLFFAVVSATLLTIK